MTISSTNRKAGPFIGSGSVSVFPFTFKVFTNQDVEVVRLNVGSGAQTTLVLSTDYSVSLNADQDNNPGGSVTLTAPLATGYNLIVTSGIPEIQGVDLANAGGFYPNVFNDEFDLLTILVQQLQEQVSRCLKFPITDGSSADLPAATVRANKLFTFGADGSVSLVAVAPSGASLFSGVLNGTVDGSNKVFTLTNNGSPLGRTPLQATVWQNFPLAPGVGYTAGPGVDQVTFTIAPVSDDTLFAQGVY